MKDEGKVSSSASASASVASSSSVVGSHDAFRMVDDLVAKPTYGSDGAASWQTFRNEAATKDGRMRKGSSSLGSAPLAPLKKLDRVALQFQSWDDEVKYERALRQQEGQADMNSGYQLFHEKRKKKQTETEKGVPLSASTEPEARDGDGADKNRKRDGVDHASDEANDNESIKKKTKKKKKIKAAVLPVVVDTPDHPLQQLAEAMQRRHQQQQQQQQRASSALPAGWESAHDSASQKTYYFNRTLGRRQWSVPGVVEAPHAAVATSANASVPPSGSGAAGDGTGRSPGRTDEADGDMLPPGWVAVTDPSTRKTYYYHAETRETRWDKPTILAAHADPDADEP